MNFRNLINKNPCYPVFGSENIKNHNFFNFASIIVSSHVGIIQLREKNLSSLDFYKNALLLKKICAVNNCKLIINDRIDIAMAVDADGVHIGQTDIPYAVARKMLGVNKIIGLSLDNMENLIEANTIDVDYVAANGVFSSLTKNIDSHIWGAENLKKAINISTHPLIAIGGINEQNINQISGICDGFAVVGDICNALEPKEKISKLNELFLKNKINN